MKIQKVTLETAKELIKRGWPYKVKSNIELDLNQERFYRKTQIIFYEHNCVAFSRKSPTKIREELNK